MCPLNNSREDTACFSRRAFDVMIDLTERWSEHNRPFAFRQAFAVLLGHVAAMRSHDVPRLHRTSGFPLKFVSLVVSKLLSNALWLSDEGYADLISIIEDRQGASAFDEALGEMTNLLFEHEIDNALKAEWDRAMGSRSNSSQDAVFGIAFSARQGRHRYAYDDFMRWPDAIGLKSPCLPANRPSPNLILA